MEQIVSKERTAGSKMLYALLCALSVLFLVIALFFAANVLGTSAEGGIAISWHAAIGCILTLASAAAVWRCKDRLNMEYDYAVEDGIIYVTAVLNNRRRVQKLQVEIGKISACGKGHINEKAASLYLNKDADLIYIQYEDKGEKHTVLLELNDEMISALRRGLRVGAWRNPEGKTSNYAGLS